MYWITVGSFIFESRNNGSLNIDRGCQNKEGYENKELGKGRGTPSRKQITSRWKQARTVVGSARDIDIVMSSSLADASRARGGILKESTAMAYMPQEDAQRQAVAAKQDYWFLKTLSHPNRDPIPVGEPSEVERQTVPVRESPPSHPNFN